MKVNNLTLIKKLPNKSKDGHFLALWKCNCGNEKTIIFSRVKNGYTKSCGCLIDLPKANLKHGKRNTSTYRSWQAAKFRCTNPNSKDWPKYGGQRILMCDAWLNSFEEFYKDLGDRPPNTTLDRIDSNKGYEPGNCRWATKSEQQQNKKTSFIWFVKGKIFNTSQEAAFFYSVTITTITRWVLGFYDKRRNSFTPPKQDCYRKERYQNA